ncbi:hypothetical protein D3C85_1738530 [compost metagenome]
MHQPRIAQHAKVMGHARLRPAAVQLAAAGFGHARQVAHDTQAHRVAQGIEQAFQGKVFRVGMLIGSHGRHDNGAIINCHSSIMIELS